MGLRDQPHGFLKIIIFRMGLRDQPHINGITQHLAFEMNDV